MHLNVFVSQRCFLHCKGCYSFSRIEKEGQLLETKKIIDFLKFAYDSGINKITLCGGDPLTRRDIIDLLKEIKKIGFNISIDTVGTSIIRNVVNADGSIINKVNVAELALLVDEIGLPIDGSNNEIFRKFRVTKDDIFSEQLKICTELQKYDVNICINTVVHKENLNDAENLSKIINTLGKISKWQLFQYAPLGKYGKINRALFEITEIEFEKYKQRILSSCVKSEIIEFKDYKLRDKTYMLIDNSGDVWIPEYKQSLFNSLGKIIDERKIIGNITVADDWNGICKKLKMEDNKRE